MVNRQKSQIKKQKSTIEDQQSNNQHSKITSGWSMFCNAQGTSVVTQKNTEREVIKMMQNGEIYFSTLWNRCHTDNILFLMLTYLWHLKTVVASALKRPSWNTTAHKRMRESSFLCSVFCLEASLPTLLPPAPGKASASFSNWLRAAVFLTAYSWARS